MVLAPYVVPMFQAHQDLRIFQQDNARPHTVMISMNFLQAVSGKSFILTSPNPYSTVCIRNTETGLS
jgi:hypothetical protein